MSSLLRRRAIQGLSALSHSGFNGLTVTREPWKSTACLDRKWWDLYTLLFTFHSGWLRRAGGTAQMCLFLFLLSPFLCQQRCLSTSFTDQPFCSVLFSAGLVFVVRFFLFLIIECCFPSQTAFSSCSVYFTWHRKRWKGMNLGRETKACNKLYSELPCSMLTGNKKTCHADTYSWKLGLPWTVVLNESLSLHPSQTATVLCPSWTLHCLLAQV